MQVGYRCVALGAALLSSSAAVAQQQVLADDESSEIVVTATKRESRLSDVPLAVSALGEEALERAGVSNFVDYARLVPSLSFSDLGSGRQRPAIRGINVNTGLAAVGYYIDETPIPATTGTVQLTNINPNLFDIDRIEVLRGPQGSLYGSGSMGGTIRIIPNQPDAAEFAASGRLTGEVINGDALGGRVEGSLNIPVVADLIALRLVGWTRRADGFIERQAAGVAVDDVPDERTEGFRAALAIDTEALRLTGSIFEQNQHFSGSQTVTFGPTNREGRLVQDLLFDVPEPNDNDFRLLNLKAELDLGFGNLLSSTSSHKGSYRIIEETGALLGTFFDSTVASDISDVSRQRSFTQELRLSSKAPLLGFDWIAGAFYTKNHVRSAVDWVVPTFASVAGDAVLYTIRSHTTLRQQALFGELARTFGEVTLTTGARYYDTKGNRRATADGVFNGGPSTSPAQPAESRGSVLKFNAAWKPTDDTTLYAQAVEGFRPGFGVNPLAASCSADARALGIDPSSAEVRPDGVWNYELGAKTAARGGRVRASAALYRIDWTDIQLSVFLPCGFSRASNAGDARVNGTELEGSIRLTDSLDIGGSVSYNDAKFRRVLPGTAAQVGDRVLDVPRWQLSAYSELRQPLSSSINGLLRLDGQYTSNALLFFDRDLATAPAPLRYRQRPSIFLLNARVGVETGRWSLALFGRNLTNQVEITGFGDSAALNIQDRPRLTVNQPRTIGLEINARF